MKIKAGDYVDTPRFLKVRIEAIYLNSDELFENGYTEPTHYHESDYEIRGKTIGLNRMVFAAACKG